MFLPDTIISKLRERYCESSIKTMDSQIKRLHVLSDIQKFSPELLYDCQHITDLVTNKLSKTSVRKATLNSVMKVIEIGLNSQHDYGKLFKQLAEDHNQTRQLSRADKSLITREQIKKILDEQEVTVKDIDPLTATSRQVSAYLKYLVTALYYYLPPLRGQDYFTTIIIDTTNHTASPAVVSKVLPYNHYNIHTKQFTIKDYKTAERYGPRTITAPDPLHKIILQWREINRTKFLIPTIHGTQMDAKRFTDMLNRIFGKGISVDNLRQSYVTYEVSKMTPEEAKEIAKIMAHSIGTQQLTYKRYVD